MACQAGLLEEARHAHGRSRGGSGHIRNGFLTGAPSRPNRRALVRALQGPRRDLVFVIEETEAAQAAVVQYRGIVSRMAGRAEFGRLMIGDREANATSWRKLATSGWSTSADPGGLRELYLECFGHRMWSALAVYDGGGSRGRSRPTVIFTGQVLVEGMAFTDGFGAMCMR